MILSPVLSSNPLQNSCFQDSALFQIQSSAKTYIGYTRIMVDSSHKLPLIGCLCWHCYGLVLQNWLLLSFRNPMQGMLSLRLKLIFVRQSLTVPYSYDDCNVGHFHLPEGFLVPRRLHFYDQKDWILIRLSGVIINAMKYSNVFFCLQTDRSITSSRHTLNDAICTLLQIIFSLDNLSPIY